MVTVKFYGDLKQFMNEPVELEVDTFSELMSGLLTQIKGLREHLKNGFYKVRIGEGTYLEENQVKADVAFNADCTIHFTPVVAGAGKGGGGLQMIAGAVLIAIAYINPFGYLSGPMVTAMYAAGASMAISGAISMITKVPDMNTKTVEGEKNQSTSFSNLKNLTPQGRPIPLLYGRMMTSLVLVSQGVETYDDVPEADNTQSGNGKKRTVLGKHN